MLSRIKANIADEHQLLIEYRKLEISYSIFFPPQLFKQIKQLSLDLGLPIETLIDCLAVLPPKLNLGGKTEIRLLVGHLYQKTINDRLYWYWRYYTRDGKKADDYMGKHRDRALARAREVGIPPNANPRYKRKSKCKS